MRKFYFIVLAVILGIIAVSPALAQEGSASVLEIISPKEGELITGDEILLNIKFGSESGNHAHIWLNEPNPTQDNLKSQENPGPFLFRDVKPGDHTIIVELAGEDHKPVDQAQKITLKVKTRSAADVTQEEIAKALSQVKPVENENINDTQKLTTDCIGGPNGTDCASQSKPTSPLIWIIFGIIGIAIFGGIIFFLRRAKKRE